MLPRWLALPEALRLPPRLYAWSSCSLPFPHRPLTPDVESLTAPHSRIYIIGAGNLGRLFAMSLAKNPAKPPITLVVHRKEQLEEWSRSPGLEIHRGDAVANNQNFAVEWWSEERPEMGPVVEVAGGGVMYNVIVATKAAGAMAEVDRMRRYLGAESTVAFAQNGMNKLWPPMGEPYLQSRGLEGDKAPSWLVLVTKHGVFSVGAFKSRHAAIADLQFGAVAVNGVHGDRSRYLSKLLLQGEHLAAREVSRADLWLSQLEKLVINASLNPTTALLRVQNGVVFAKREGPVARVVSEIIKEASEVVTASIRSEAGRDILGVKGGDEIPKDVLDRFSFETLLEKCYAVGTLTRENMSSMLQDFVNERPTEIQEFNGWIVDTGKFLGIESEAKTNKAIVRLVEMRAHVNEDTIEQEVQAKAD